MSAPQNETVVLIHGLGGSRFDMWPIARRLRRLSFTVEYWGYRSFANRIETHAERLAVFLVDLDRRKPNGFHLVTHSMGGIIARAAFAQFSLTNLKRVVMLAPPHQGSHAARKLAPYFGWLTPSLLQLSDDENSFVNGLPNSFRQNNLEFGIIESTKDRVIRPGFVELDGCADIASVVGQHGILTWYSRTLTLVENFLLHGKFEKRLEPKQSSS
jgi:pimeloyl-ACP methyl ester carboxylesterase